MTDQLFDLLTGCEPDSWDPEADGDLGDNGTPARLGKLGVAAPPAAGPLTAGAPNPTGLSTVHRVRARDLACGAAALAYRNRGSVHYSQNARLRWTGIRADLKAWQGEYPKNADCSSYVTWAVWNGLDHYDVRDVVNGLRWQAGYTGTMLTHGAHVSPSRLIRGDAVIYGRSWPGLHTAIYMGGGMVLSHGSERGPLLLPVFYRGDVLGCRRYI